MRLAMPLFRAIDRWADSRAVARGRLKAIEQGGAINGIGAHFCCPSIAILSIYVL